MIENLVQGPVLQPLKNSPRKTPQSIGWLVLAVRVHKVPKYGRLQKVGALICSTAPVIRAPARRSPEFTEISIWGGSCGFLLGAVVPG